MCQVDGRMFVSYQLTIVIGALMYLIILDLLLYLLTFLSKI